MGVHANAFYRLRESRVELAYISGWDSHARRAEPSLCINAWFTACCCVCEISSSGVQNCRFAFGMVQVLSLMQIGVLSLRTTCPAMVIRRVHEWDLVPRLLRHVASSSEAPLLCDEEVADLREDLRLFLSSKGLECSSTVPSGQPLALHLLRGMRMLSNDVDAELPVQLERGVPTGIRDTIPSSRVWCQWKYRNDLQ